jgi:hypothetical protein
MLLAKSADPGAIRFAGWRTPRTGLTADRRQAAHADLDRVPMTARTAGAGDDEVDRSRNTKALPHRWLRPLDGGLPTGTAMSAANKS